MFRRLYKGRYGKPRCGGSPRRNEDAWIRAARDAPTLGHGVEAKKSKIPHGGLGLFATQPFLSGDLVTEYAGKEISRTEADRLRRQDPANASHIRKTGDQRFVIDGLRVPRDGKGGGSFANQDPDGKDNTKYRNVGSKVYLVATHNIHPKDEITANYGRDYVWGRR